MNLDKVHEYWIEDIKHMMEFWQARDMILYSNLYGPLALNKHYAKVFFKFCK